MRSLSLFIVIFYTFSVFGLTGAQKLIAAQTPAAAFTTTQSLAFDGSSGLVSGSNHSVQNFSTTMSMAVWVKGSNTMNLAAIISKDDGSTQRSYGIQRSNSVAGKCRILFVASGPTYRWVQTSVTVFDGTWHWVAATFSSGTYHVYVDGTEDSSLTTIIAGSVSTIVSSTTPFGLSIGNNGFTTWYDGKITNVSLWNVALSGAEVAALASGGKPANLNNHSQSAHLAAWYRAGDGDGTGANGILDSSANNFPMSVTGGVTIANDAP